MEKNTFAWNEAIQRMGGEPDEQLRIVRAAIRDRNGGIHSVPPPGRHRDVIKLMREHGVEGHISQESQGFLLSNGQFCRRGPAARIALRAGQLKNGKQIASVLTSEDLW